MSSFTLSKLLRDLSTLQIPSSCEKKFRLLFYFFGHGTEREICLSDGNIECSKIIAALQKINSNVFKIALFDSCRVECRQQPPVETSNYNYNLEVNMDNPHQVVSLQGNLQWQDKERYPYASCVNMLVIYATDFKSSAYYSTSDEMKGCGLVTHFFTTLAPLRNEPLPAMLAEVRKEVDEFIKKKALSPQSITIPAPQVLVYEDRLMGNVNLLAESKGEGMYSNIIVLLSVQIPH